MASIQASVLHAAKTLKVESRNLNEPAAGEVQVAIRATGLCGSDLHYYNDFRNGDILVKEPLSLGHESAGVVVALGPDVSGFHVGDKVALEVGIPCGNCQRCREGRYNICSTIRFRSSAKSVPHFQGTLQDRLNHPANRCYKLPENVSFELGALVEPLSVALHATRRAALPDQSTTLVYGAGAVGLLTAAMCKHSGARTVVIADIDEARVNFAVDNGFADLGYTVPLAPRCERTVEEDLDIARQTASTITSLVTPSGSALQPIDAVFECTGAQACVQASIYAARSGGKVMLIGMGTPIQTLPLSAAALREVDICGVFRYANTYSACIDLLSKPAPGKPDLSKLVTHRYTGLVAVPEAFAAAGKSKDKDGNLVLKVVVETVDG